MGNPSPKIEPQSESRRLAFEELKLFQPGLRKFGENEPEIRRFARYMTLKYELNSRDGGDLFQDLMAHLLKMPDPLGKIQADKVRRGIDSKAWLKSMVYELAYKLWTRAGNRSLPQEAQVIREHEEYELALTCEEDSIEAETPYAPELAAVRQQLRTLFRKELESASANVKRVVAHLADMQGPRIQRQALANLLGVTSKQVNNILNEYARWVADFVARHH